MSRLVLLISFTVLLIHLFTVNIFPALIYDEVYYVNSALYYLDGNYAFDVHPPLGKLIISFFIFLFGNNPVGWRIGSVLFGVATIIATALWSKRFLGTSRVRDLVALILATEMMFFVSAHVALLDIFGVALVMLGFLVSTTKYSRFAAILLGLATAVKWSNAVFLIPLLFIQYSRDKNLKNQIFSWLFFVIGYLVSFVPDLLVGLNPLMWHLYAYRFHQKVDVVHTYHSPWWSWWFDYRPTWLVFEQNQNQVRGVVSVINPITLISVLIAVVASIWEIVRKKANKNIAIILGIFIIFISQWALVNRTTFNYNLLPSLPFGVVLLSYWLDRMGETKVGRKLLGPILSLIILMFIFFLPLLVGVWVDYDFFKRHIWFPSWT